ncbi:MAG: copper homeostasis protein CutC, partial [Streptococcus sp.]
MIYEFCAENVTLLEKAMQAGARRIELCDNLAVGGTTPSYGVTKAAVELAANYDT